MRKIFDVSAALIFLAISGTSLAQFPSSGDTSSSASNCSGTLTDCLQGQSSDATDESRSAVGGPSPNGRSLSSTNQLQSESRANAATLTPLTQSAPPLQLPPAVPSEFQNFVAATTGQHLDIYGTGLFRNVPASFAPSNLTPVSADYVIGPDDELRIHIWGGINYTGNLRVDRSGNIFLPQVGSVHVSGVRFAELDQHLREATARIFRSFDLSADLGRIRSIQVYVTGQARRSGVYTVSSLSSLVDALFASGGPSPQGSLRHILVKREGKVVADFDLYALLLHGDKSGDMRLQAEDVLFIPPAGAQVAVIGSINTPAIYEMRDHETIGDLLEAAGNTSSLSARTKVSLDRAELNQRTVLEFPLDSAGLSAPLADGDIVRVFAIVPSYRKTVTLRGSVANAGRYGWNENMHLSDLIPDRDALMSRDYWWKRNHLGLASPDFEPQVASPDPLLNTLSNSIGSNLDSQGNRAASQSQQASHAPIAALTAQNIPPNTAVRIVAPELDWSYAVIERTDPATLRTSLIPFDLGKLVLQHDGRQDLALEAGDTVTIFSQADIKLPSELQTKYVTLEGEVNHAGTYSVQPNETLRDILRRAGGLTSKAYLYGSEFERESARILQQQRIDEYVRALQLNTSHSAITFANYASLSGQGGSQATNSTLQTEFLQQLKSIRASGRVVLKVTPSSKSIDDLPALTLEDGDRFIVPTVPSTVNVVGAVYNQNTFLYRSGTVNRYLQLAGGTDRSADARRAYVIRADGSVLSRDATSSLWNDSFKRTKMFPGDTIVVPDKTFAPNLNLKSFLEWTQMFSQLAMGAATISLLK
jgi:protein involved in polysaccharide export with SLBB domain